MAAVGKRIHGNIRAGRQRQNWNCFFVMNGTSCCFIVLATFPTNNSKAFSLSPAKFIVVFIYDMKMKTLYTILLQSLKGALCENCDVG